MSSSLRDAALVGTREKKETKKKRVVYPPLWQRVRENENLRKKNYTLAAKDPKQRDYERAYSLGACSLGGLQSGGLH